jgi:hypothetical protein
MASTDDSWLGYQTKCTPAHQRGNTPSRCTTACATPLHTSCSRTLTQRQQRPSSQRTRIHGRSVATYVVGWTSGDELDGVMAPSLDAVPRTTRESPAFATTMRSPCLTMDNAVQPFWTASKRQLRRSLPYTEVHAAT